MALHPAPTIESKLVLVQQPLVLTGVGHTALITFAAFNSANVSVQSCANQLQIAFANAWAAQFDSGVVMEKPSVLLGDGGTTPGFAVATGSVTPGTNAIDSPPPQVAVLIKKVSAVAGKKNRGRSYFPWIAGRLTIGEDGALSGGDVTAFQAAANAWLSAMGTASLPMVIANKTLAVDGSTGKSFVTAITAGPNVSSLVVEPKVATQRRRLKRT